MSRFKKLRDRNDAGILLCEQLTEERITADLIVALPRGGVPIGLILSQCLGKPLKLIYIRKLGHPLNPELAIGAVTEDALLLQNAETQDHASLKEAIQRERNRIASMKQQFGLNITEADVSGKKVILTDDGIATGICMALAARELRKMGASAIRMVVPVCPAATASRFKTAGEQMTCLFTPQQFFGIGAFYEDFDQLNDRFLENLLNKK